MCERMKQLFVTPRSVKRQFIFFGEMPECQTLDDENAWQFFLNAEETLLGDWQ